MEKIRINDLIKFRSKSERTRISFANNLKSEKKKIKGSSGGDYWICCLSAILNVFKSNNSNLLKEKIEELTGWIDETPHNNVKIEFKRNIDVLNSFEDFDFDMIKPVSKFCYIIKSTNISIFNINGLPIQAKPDFVFKFSNNGIEEVGSVWFVAQLNGFTKTELGMFVDVLYRYMQINYSNDYKINKSYCIAVDVNAAQFLSYKELLEGGIPMVLDKTIEELKKLL